MGKFDDKMKGIYEEEKKLKKNKNIDKTSAAPKKNAKSLKAAYKPWNDAPAIDKNRKGENNK